MRVFSSSPYPLLRFARDHRGVRYLIIVLGLLAFLAIGAASAHDWRAPSTEGSRPLPAIELRTGPRASKPKAQVVKTTKKLRGRRSSRRKPRSATADDGRRRATAPASLRAPIERPDDRDDRGAAAVPVPAPTPAGNGDDDDDDEGGEGHDGDDVSDGGDD